jgi:repressor LexA
VKGLTERQQAILSFIRNYTSTSGVAPSRAEIATQFGFTPPAAHFHLQALVKKGAIELTPKVKRGIKVLS